MLDYICFLCYLRFKCFDDFISVSLIFKLVYMGNVVLMFYKICECFIVFVLY